MRACTVDAVRIEDPSLLSHIRRQWLANWMICAACRRQTRPSRWLGVVNACKCSECIIIIAIVVFNSSIINFIWPPSSLIKHGMREVPKVACTVYLPYQPTHPPDTTHQTPTHPLPTPTRHGRHQPSLNRSSRKINHAKPDETKGQHYMTVSDEI